MSEAFAVGALVLLEEVPAWSEVASVVVFHGFDWLEFVGFL